MRVGMENGTLPDYTVNQYFDPYMMNEINCKSPENFSPECEGLVMIPFEECFP